MSVQSRSVEADDDGIRVDRWFQRHFPAVTHGMLEKLLRTGQVRLDGRRAKSGDRISIGQIIRLPPQLQSIHTKPTNSKVASGGKVSYQPESLVIYKDSQTLVLNKPAGLATQGGSGISEH